MKMFLLLAALMVFSQVGYADELIQMSNGMTCWRNSVGHVYGCSGGASTGDSGFNYVRTGKRYNYINPNQAIDTQTGQPINTPYKNRGDDK